MELKIEWDGHGLPPAGATVGVSKRDGLHVGAAYRPPFMAQVLVITRAYAILRHLGPGFSEDHECSHELGLLEFNRVRTPEELAAEVHAYKLTVLLVDAGITGSAWAEDPEATVWGEALLAAGWVKP